MPTAEYKQAYRERQLKEELNLDLSWYIDDAKLCWDVADIDVVASSDLDKEHVLAYIVRHNGFFQDDFRSNHTVVVCDGLDRPREKFLCIKELMHCYFTADSGCLTDNAHVLRRHMTELFGELSTSQSMQVVAEKQAVWMAISLICPENRRRRLKENILLEESKTYEDVAEMLGVPKIIVERMMTDEYDDMLSDMLT